MITWEEYVDLEEQRDAEPPRKALTERKTLRKPSKIPEDIQEPREGSFRRVCSTNSTAAGFQKDLCPLDLAIVPVRKLEY